MLPNRYRAPFAHSSYLLRALGFEILNAAFRSSTAYEQPKAVFRRSRWIALSRCMIHILPCVIFGFLIPLNYRAIFLGPGFSRTRPDGLYLALFQVAAKVLELICVSSLATVVVHVLRHELVSDGVPLGFVGSGIFFSQASCFWAPEMVVGAWRSVTSWKRMRLLLVIAVASFLAVLIAPSAAILLQPRIQNTPAGGTDYYIPATADELWPSVIDGSDELPECFDEADERHIVCASGGFDSLRTYFKNYNSSMYQPLMLLDFDQMRGIVVESAAARIPRLFLSGTTYGRNRETSMSQANAITATLQESLTQDWNEIAKSKKSGAAIIPANEYKYAFRRVSSVSTTNPKVQVRCAEAQNLSTNEYEVNFPVRRWVDRILKFTDKGSGFWQDDPAALNLSSTNLHPSNDLQIDWISLPTDRFGPVSGGLYLQFPMEPTMRSRAVIGCSISATWIHASIASDSQLHEAAWSIPIYGRMKANVQMGLNATSPHYKDYERLITLKERWYRSLTPFTPYEDCNNQSQKVTTLERLFADVGIATDLVAQRTQPQFEYDPSEKICSFVPANSSSYTDVDRLNSDTCNYGSIQVLIEVILASTFANGLSRYGSRRAFNLSGVYNSKDPFSWILNKPPWAPQWEHSLVDINARHNAVLPPPSHSNFVTLRMQCEVVGYSWYAHTITDYLATAVVGIYMLVAIVHMIWVLSFGVTSSSWDTITELLALALRSPIPDSLSGCGAGVKILGTYNRLVKLGARGEAKDKPSRSGETLALIVVDRNGTSGLEQNLGAASDAMKYRKVVVDRLYS